MDLGLCTLERLLSFSRLPLDPPVPCPVLKRDEKLRKTSDTCFYYFLFPLTIDLDGFVLIFFFLLQTVGVTKTQNRTLPDLTTERRGFPCTLKTPECGGAPWPLTRLGGVLVSNETSWRIPVEAVLCVLGISRQHLWSLFVRP